MKRIVKIPDKLQGFIKYELKKEYGDFGIYQERCPSGFFVSQSYLISNDNISIQIESYNNVCMSEILDAIDDYNDCKKFGFKALIRPFGYCVHPSGDFRI
jgi:hypothetical protein